MKRILTITLILILSVCSLFADDKTAELTVKAYKKKKSSKNATVEMKVIDALTGSLNTFKSSTPLDNAVIDMTDKVKTYIGDTSVDQSTDTNLSSKAAFSVHVTGNQKQTFIISVQFQALAYYGEGGNLGRYTVSSSANYSNYITARFYLVDYQLLFTDTDTASVTDTDTKITDSITNVQLTGSATNVTVPSSAPSETSDPKSTISYSWKVETTDTSNLDYVSHYWDARATFAMILNKGNETTAGSYVKAPNGIYQAPVTVSLTIGT